MNDKKYKKFGKLAEKSGYQLQIIVCESLSGFYLGTVDGSGAPFTRESVESWGSKNRAEYALRTGQWIQK